MTSHCALVYIVGGRMLWQRRQLFDQSSSPLRPIYESFETAPLESGAAFPFALGSANRLQVVLAKRTSKAASRLRFNVVISVTRWLRNPWLSERRGRSCCAHRSACPIHTLLSRRCWGSASN